MKDTVTLKRGIFKIMSRVFLALSFNLECHFFLLDRWNQKLCLSYLIIFFFFFITWTPWSTSRGCFRLINPNKNMEGDSTWRELWLVEAGKPYHWWKWTNSYSLRRKQVYMCANNYTIYTRGENFLHFSWSIIHLSLFIQLLKKYQKI